MKKILVKNIYVILLGLIPLISQATDISQMPIDSLGTVKPNLILGYDDSGSMGDTFLPDTSVPALTAQSAMSHYYNPLYYNPNITYTPWVKHTATSATVAEYYPNAPINAFVIFVSDGSAAKTSGSLTAGGIYKITYTCGSSGAGKYSNTVDYDSSLHFTTQAACNAKSGNVYTIPVTPYTVAANQSWQKGTINSSAIYYNVVASAACTVNSTTCFTAPVCTAASNSTCAVTPAGAKLQQVVIAPTDTVNLQNFANWKTYASTRRAMVSYAMSGVLSTLHGLSMGIQPFNSSSVSNAITRAADATVASKTYSSSSFAAAGQMFNLDVPSDVDTLLDIIYNLSTNSATPTHADFIKIGNTFSNASLPLALTNDDDSTTSGRKGIVQYACQKNAMFVVTDGYANESPLPAALSYTKTTWGAAAPYSTTFSKSLADISLAFYTNNIRPDLATGKVPADTYTSGNGADKNTNLHMNTYALTLGIKGNQYGVIADPYAVHPTWVDPTTSAANNTVIQIDDLWHSTINGRGQMFTATDTENLVTYVTNAMLDIILRAGSQSAIAVANVNMTTVNNAAYVSSYNASGWFGDVNKYPVNLTTGTVDTTSPAWSARDKLDALDYTTRKIFTRNNEVFGTATLPSLPMGSSPLATVPKLVSYLRGNRADEGTIFRTRTHLLGDAVNAEPVIYNGIVYQATNDGMLHALNLTTGVEDWAYVPSQNIPTLGNLSLTAYTHRYYVDGTPIVGGYAYTDSGMTKPGTLLVGGLGAGSFGYYAVDVTTPATPSARWEFPGNATDLKNGGNTSISKPRLIATKDISHPYVAIISSGYNNGTATGGDGKGHVWVVDPATGATIKELVTSDGTAAVPVGLSTFSAFVANSLTSNTVSLLYGGDELGNVWKIDASGAVSSWTITKFASIGRPITTKPEISETSNGNPIIMFGTGRLLGVTDLTNTATQGLYAIQDFQSASASVVTTSNLQQLNVSGSSGVDRIVSLPATGAGSTCADWNHKDGSGKNDNYGWYLNFPEGGERVVGNPSIGIGHIAFTTNVMSANACSSASYSWFLSLNTSNGNSCSAPVDTGSNIGHYLGGITGSRPVLISLPNGHIEMVTHLGNGDIKTVDTGAFNLVTTAVRSWRALKRPLR